MVHMYLYIYMYLFRERLSERVHATSMKRIVGGFEFIVLQRNLKEWHERPWIYRIYSINRPGRLLNFWALRVGTYSRWALIQGWVFIKFSPFSASVACLFCNNTINGNNKMRRCNIARFL